MLTRQGHWGLDLGRAEVISAFLKRNPPIGFVLVLSVASDGSHCFGPEHLKIVGQIYVNPRNRPLPQLIAGLCDNLVDQFPRPETTPINASSVESLGRSFNGGGSMGGNRIKMSARTVAEVLAGKMKTEDFLGEIRSSRTSSPGCFVLDGR
jgi:hypothetical protein